MDQTKNISGLNHSQEKFDTVLVVFVFSVGFLLRLYACINTPIVNPDGVHYIQQARAIYQGEWSRLTTCSLYFVSSYPFLVAFAYKITGDWIIAARAISLFFGFGFLFPAWFLLRRFFKTHVASLTLLIFALIPMMVSRSGDVLRDPFYWFFTSLGLYLFVRHMDRETWLPLFFCSISFLIAITARVEASLFIMVTAVFIVLFEKNNRMKKLTVFLSPLLILLLSGLIFALILNIPLKNLHRLDEITDKLVRPFDQYTNLREQLKQLSRNYPDEMMGRFLPFARNLVWLIGLGAILNKGLEAFFYPFVPFFVVGFFGLFHRIRIDRRMIYFLLLFVFGLILLYLHVLEIWIMAYRFLAILIIPAAVFAGLGMQRITGWLVSKTFLREKSAVIALVILLLISGLPKNLSLRETDKIVFRKIGETIAKNKNTPHSVVIAGANSTVHDWVTFFANIGQPELFCEKDGAIPPRLLNKPSAIIRFLKENEIRYLLWEEKRWPDNGVNPKQAFTPQHFKILGSWSHPDTRQMILFQFNK